MLRLFLIWNKEAGVMLKGARALGPVAFDPAPQAIGTGDVNPMTFLFNAKPPL